jgi:hypothetical protein
MQTPFAEVYDGCSEYEKGSKRKEQEQQLLITCHITWHQVAPCLFSSALDHSDLLLCKGHAYWRRPFFVI